MESKSSPDSGASLRKDSASSHESSVWAGSLDSNLWGTGTASSSLPLSTSPVLCLRKLRQNIDSQDNFDESSPDVFVCSKRATPVGDDDAQSGERGQETVARTDVPLSPALLLQPMSSAMLPSDGQNGNRSPSDVGGGAACRDADKGTPPPARLANVVHRSVRQELDNSVALDRSHSLVSTAMAILGWDTRAQDVTLRTPIVCMSLDLLCSAWGGYEGIGECGL